MSRNNKNARLVREEKEASISRLNGNKGPKQTTPKHGKASYNRWWNDGITSVGKAALGKNKKPAK